MPAGNSYAGFGSTSSGNAPGQLGSTADILAGHNGGSTAYDLAMEWRVRTASERPSGPSGNPVSPPLPATGSQGLISDVLDLTGMSSWIGSHVQTDPFVLQVNYSPASLGGSEGNLARGGSIYLGWLDPSMAQPTGLWRNATAGDFGAGLSGDVFQNVQGSWDSFVSAHSITNANLSSFLGSYGVDIANHQVWAVVNHNSEFAVVPEPSSLLLGVCGPWSCLAIKKRQAKQPTGRSRPDPTMETSRL